MGKSILFFCLSITSTFPGLNQTSPQPALFPVCPSEFLNFCSFRAPPTTIPDSQSSLILFLFFKYKLPPASYSFPSPGAKGGAGGDPRHRDRRVVGWGPQGGEKLFFSPLHLFIYLVIYIPSRGTRATRGDFCLGGSDLPASGSGVRLWPWGWRGAVPWRWGRPGAWGAMGGD